MELDERELRNLIREEALNLLRDELRVILDKRGDELVVEVRVGQSVIAQDSINIG